LRGSGPAARDRIRLQPDGTGSRRRRARTRVVRDDLQLSLNQLGIRFDHAARALLHDPRERKRLRQDVIGVEARARDFPGEKLLVRASGCELALGDRRRLRQQPQFAGTVLAALTGYGQESDRQRSREAGFDLHLGKPVQPETYTSLAGLLRGSKSAVERPRSVNGHSRLIATDLLLQQLAMANTYLDIAANSAFGDSSRARLIAHASRAHDRVSAWLFSGACADDRAGDMFRELRMLRERIRK